MKEIIENVRNGKFNVLNGNEIVIGDKVFEYELCNGYVVLMVEEKKIVIPENKFGKVFDVEKIIAKRKLEEIIKNLESKTVCFEIIDKCGKTMIRDEKGNEIFIVPYVCTLEICMGCNECRHFNEIKSLVYNGFEFDVNEIGMSEELERLIIKYM